jgi:hypothetical protein
MQGSMMPCQLICIKGKQTLLIKSTCVGITVDHTARQGHRT